VSESYAIVTNKTITTIGNEIQFRILQGGNDWVGFNFSAENNKYIKPEKNKFLQFSVKVTVGVTYNTKKRMIMQDTAIDASLSDAETNLAFTTEPDPIVKPDIVAIVILSSLGGAVVIVVVILVVINGKVILEQLENRHATTKRLTSELMSKFQESKQELQLVSTLPDWVAPWQIPLSKRDIEKFEKALAKKKKEELDKERKPGTNIKIENLFTIAEYIIERQKKYREQMDDSGSDESDDVRQSKQKKKSKKNLTGSKGSKKNLTGSKGSKKKS